MANISIDDISLNEEDLKSNSYKSRKKRDIKKEENKEQQSVDKRTIKNPAKLRKKTLGEKFRSTFFGEKAAEVKDYIFHDVMIPAFKDTFSDIVSNGIEMLLYGEVRGGRYKKKGGNKYDYSRIYSISNRDRDRDSDWRNRRNHNSRPGSFADFNDIVFDSVGDIDELLDIMAEEIDRHGVVTVASLYDAAGITPDFTDHNWGWEALGKASYHRIRGGGYVLDLPKPIYLKE